MGCFENWETKGVQLAKVRAIPKQYCQLLPCFAEDQDLRSHSAHKSWVGVFIHFNKPLDILAWNVQFHPMLFPFKSHNICFVIYSGNVAGLCGLSFISSITSYHTNSSMTPPTADLRDRCRGGSGSLRLALFGGEAAEHLAETWETVKTPGLAWHG